MMNKDTLWCTYYKKLLHTIEKYWKLHGKPTKGGQQKGQGQVFVANCQQPIEGKALDQANTMELNQEEIEKLRNLLGSLEKKPRTSTCTLAFTGISSSSLTFHALDITLPNT